MCIRFYFFLSFLSLFLSLSSLLEVSVLSSVVITSKDFSLTRMLPYLVSEKQSVF